jgi:hypothetical protein
MAAVPFGGFGQAAPFGLTIERDLHFTPRYPLSVYAEAARRAGSIVLGEQRLRRAANRISGRG